MSEKYPALRYSDDMGGNFKNGVWNIECDSWRGFEDRIEEFKGPEYKYVWRGESCAKYVCRGQSCEETLKPSIYRDSTPNDTTIRQYLYQFRKDMPGGDALEQFLERAKKERTPEFEEALSEYYNMIHPKADDNDPKENYEKDFIDDIYWAIGQHHGLKTPLLDWTMDPYKALFFAFCAWKKENNKRVIFGLAEKNRLLLKNGRLKKRYIELLTNLNFVQRILDSSGSPRALKEIIRPMFDRIKAQDGIFSKSLQNENVEKHTRRCYSYYEKHRNQKIVFLIRILIPNGLRKDFLQKLEGKKITYKTMYPDLLGTVLYCNLKLDPHTRQEGRP
jgi:hypothetical protein